MNAPPIALDAAYPADGADAAAFARSLGRLSFAIFAAAIAVALYAAFAGRALHADGAHYLVQMLTKDGFNFAEPSRPAAQFLLQAPTVIGIRLGLVDLAGATLLFCLTLELAPLALLALCYAALPPGYKQYFCFPLLHYLAGMLGASASPIVESLVATAYFWLLFYVILFRPLRGWALGAILVLVVPIAVMHESMALLGLFLALAAAWRAWREPRRSRAAVFWTLAGVSVAAALVQVGFIIRPRSLGQRDDVFAGFLTFLWLYGRGGGFNVPAILGLAALLAICLLPGRRPGTREHHCSWLAVAVIGGLATAGIVVAAAVPRTVMPWLHFDARHNPGLYAVGFAMGAFLSLLIPRIRRLWARPAVIAVCGTLAFGALGWHAVQVFHWSAFVADVRGILAQSRGLVPREAAAASLGERDRRVFLNMAWSWSMPELSIVLSPGGRVAALIGRQRPEPWAWDESDPAKIPRSRFFDTTAYRAALEETRGQGRRP